MSVPDDLARYHRQMLLEGIGVEGQRRLLSSHALIVGVGALGCVSADLLARAGVGRITLVDRDVVEVTNLQRQVLFDERDAADAVPKAEAARRRLAAVNSEIEIHAVVADFEHRRAEKIALGGLLGRPDAILDGTDNFETRYLLNDLAVKHGVPYCYAGAVATTGMAMIIVPGETPCLRCLFEEPPPAGSAPTCDTVGVLGATVAITGAYQAGEAIKILSGNAGRLSGSLLEFDQWANTRRRLDIGAMKRDDCPCCAHKRFEYLGGERAGSTVGLCGQNAVQVACGTEGRVDLDALAARLRAHGAFERTAFLVRGEVEGLGLTVFGDGRAIVSGTDRPDLARSIYAKYVGH